MSAPGGLCGSCGSPLQWTVRAEDLLVRCRFCAELFEEDGMDIAGEVREGREAEAGRGVPIKGIVQNA